MSQKPTVGRQVHYYGRKTTWHHSLATRSPSEREREYARTFEGPFAATVVAVHSDGLVNLLICFPGECYDSLQNTQLVCGIGEQDDEHGKGYWTWPPRV